MAESAAAEVDLVQQQQQQQQQQAQAHSASQQLNSVAAEATQLSGAAVQQQPIQQRPLEMPSTPATEAPCREGTTLQHQPQHGQHDQPLSQSVNATEGVSATQQQLLPAQRGQQTPDTGQPQQQHQQQHPSHHHHHQYMLQQQAAQHQNQLQAQDQHQLADDMVDIEWHDGDYTA